MSKKPQKNSLPKCVDLLYFEIMHKSGLSLSPRLQQEKHDTTHTHSEGLNRAPGNLLHPSPPSAQE